LYHASAETYNPVYLTLQQNLLYWWNATLYQSIAITGVPLFVMLSGALLLQPSKTDEPIRVLLKKRLSRIGYAFAFWTVIYFAWSYFADHTQITLHYIIQSLLSEGAYPHFWFLYIIAGLYIITPILRVIVAHADRKILRYLLVLWFIGTALVPLFQLITGFSVNGNLFLFGGYIGYFILGIYLMKTSVRLRTLLAILALCLAWTIGGSWLMTFPYHSLERYYFFFYTLAANVVLTAVAIFLLLRRFPADWPTNQHPRISKVVRAISDNTLPLYLFHMIIMLSLERGYFGFTLSLTKMNPIVETPIATAVTLLITLGLVLVMKKVPILRKLVG
jgi:surface polysaccharide O-acyltransferase-like enzyme